MDTKDTAETTEPSGSSCGGAPSKSSAESSSGGTTTESSPESSCGGTETSPSSAESSCGATDSTSSDESSCGGASDGEDGASVGATADDFDADPGRLVAVGIGPGQPEGMTRRARSALLDAEHVVGYTTYVELLPDEVTEGAEDVYETPMCGEVSRTEEAVDRTLAGNDVAIVGSGDPNVYALAGLALEILESKGGSASAVDFEVVPGVPAAQSCGARLGAPLVNDTVSVSLSDHLTPMDDIESRLRAVAPEGFTIAIYNPWSRKRRENFQTCCEILLEHRPPETPVGIVHGAGRDDEETEIVELGELPELGESDLIDMTTTILVGNDDTYVWDERMVTPRGYESKYAY